MNIGIIVYSQTGNTHSVALKLQERLAGAGHSVELHRLSIVGTYQPGNKDVQFTALPSLERYDGIVFAAPVQGFALAPVMQSYFTHITSLQRKKVAGFVTQFFPFPWMGGTRAINQLKQICQSKGVKVCGTGVVNWKNSNREQRIEEIVERLSGLF